MLPSSCRIWFTARGQDCSGGQEHKETSWLLPSRNLLLDKFKTKCLDAPNPVLDLRSRCKWIVVTGRPFSGDGRFRRRDRLKEPVNVVGELSRDMLTCWKTKPRRMPSYWRAGAERCFAH